VPRVENLFALTALAYLAAGLYVGTYSGFVVLVGQTQVPGLRFQVLFYGVAALFGVFAFLNSIGYIIQLSPTATKWHFWLSFVGVALCFIGGAIFRFGAENAKEPWTLGVNAIVFSVGAGLLAFLPVQLWFAFDLVRAVLRLKTS
jgi:hypothetical protein